MSKSMLKKRFSVKDRGPNETLGKIETDFLDVSDAYFWFRVEVNAFRTGNECPGQPGPITDCVPLMKKGGFMP